MANSARIESQLKAHAVHATVAASERRLELYAKSHYEAQRRTFAGLGRPDLSAVGSSAELGDDAPNAAPSSPHLRTTVGVELVFPDINFEAQRTAQTIFAALPPEHGLTLQAAARQLGAAVLAQLTTAAPSAAASPQLLRAASALSEDYLLTTGQARQEEVVHNTVAMGVWGMEQELRGYFERLGQQQHVAQEVRTDIADLQATLATWPDDGSTQRFDYRQVQINGDGSVQVVAHRDVELTKAEAQALLSSLQLSVESLGQVEMRDTLQIQKMTQEWKQGQETLSNIMKMQHETYKTIIHNAKA